MAVMFVPAWLGVSVAHADPTTSPVSAVPIDASLPASASPAPSEEYTDDGDVEDISPDTAVDNTRTYLVMGGAVVVAIIAGGVVALVKR